MKKFLFLLLSAIGFSFGMKAQIVTTQPAIVQQSSAPITVTFHADRGNKALAGLAQNVAVYAHTGVILEGSDQWTNAPAWLDNSAKYKLTYIGPDTYTLTIPDINTYYGLTSGQKVSKLAFVFRNATGTKEGKTASGGDIFIDVAAEGFGIELTSSAEGNVIDKSTEVTLILNSTAPATLSIYKNSTSSTPLTSSSNATSISYTVNIDDEGTTNFIGVGNDGTTTRTSQLSFFVTPAPVSENYPGGVPKMGPVENPDGSVTFCIGAPGKKSVQLIGGWNDYAFTAAQTMKYQDYQGNRYFWTTVPGLKTGKDYPYYFLVDNSVAVGDPYARLVLDPWNDKYIPASVFPDMPEYPSALVDQVPLAVYNSAASSAYRWQNDNFKRPEQSDLIIYELLVRDFTGTENKANAEGTLAGVREKLDYLQQLGVNAIEFLPIMEFNGNNSWGYNTNFYFAPDKAYGTPDDYKALFDEIHGRGMAVILDIVFNQTDGLHPWYQMYPIASNPFYNGAAPHAYSVLNDWNQDNPLVQQQFKDALQYWLKEYHVDGFRFDLVKGLGSNQSYGATYNATNNTWSGVTDAKTNAYNASRVARMKELHDAMRLVDPDAYFINENLAGAEEENQMAQDGETNWANINDAAAQFVMGYSSDSNLNRFYAPLDSRTWGSTVSYAESHDEERIAYKVKQYGATGIKNNSTMTMRRLGSLAAMMLMTPGSHMIWQFEELGADQTTKNADGGNNTDPKKVVWNLLNRANNAGLMQSYRELCWLKRDNPDLFKEGVATTVTCNSTNWAGGRFITLNNGKSALYLVVNPNVSATATLTLQGVSANADLQLMSASYGVTPTRNGNRVTLAPGAYAIYGTQDLLDVEQIEVDSAPAQVTVENGEIKVTGDYHSLRIYNLSGVQVSPAQTLPSGIYFVEVDGNVTKVLVR